MLVAKMDLLMKKLDKPSGEEAQPVQAMEAHMTCEVYGSPGHSGNSCPETRPEEASFINTGDNFNNGYRPQAGWNSRPNFPFANQGTSSGSQNFLRTILSIKRL